MALFRNYFLAFLLIPLILLSNENTNSIKNISLIDFSKLKSFESQFNIGFQKNNFNNNSYFSIDKLISHNLTGSIKISLLRHDKLEIYNQNTFLISGIENPLNFLIAMNYLTDNFKVNKWLNIGFIFNLFKNHYLLDDNFFIGIYSDIDINSQNVNYFNYYLRMEKELTKAISIGLSTRYNNKYNHNLELIIRI